MNHRDIKKDIVMGGIVILKEPYNGSSLAGCRGSVACKKNTKVLENASISYFLSHPAFESIVAIDKSW